MSTEDLFLRSYGLYHIVACARIFRKTPFITDLIPLQRNFTAIDSPAHNALTSITPLYYHYGWGERAIGVIAINPQPSLEADAELFLNRIDPGTWKWSRGSVSSRERPTGRKSCYRNHPETYAILPTPAFHVLGGILMIYEKEWNA